MPFPPRRYVPGVIPIVSCGLNTADTSPDVFWESDDPANGQATASLAVTADQARSTAVLDLPAGAVVTNAYIYWGARLTGTDADATVVVDRPGVTATTLTAASSYTIAQTGGDVVYESVADATDLAFAQGLTLVEDEGLPEEVAGLVEPGCIFLIPADGAGQAVLKQAGIADERPGQR